MKVFYRMFLMVIIMLAMLSTGGALADDAKISEVEDCTIFASDLDNPAGHVCWTYGDLIHSEIDHHAQSAIIRMFHSDDKAVAEDASEILCAVKAGVLKGVYISNQEVPAKRAQKAQSGWWLIIPQGEQSTCYEVPSDKAPLIAFRNQIKDNKDFVASALRTAWDSCDIQITTAPRCFFDNDDVYYNQD